MNLVSLDRIAFGLDINNLRDELNVTRLIIGRLLPLEAAVECRVDIVRHLSQIPWTGIIASRIEPNQIILNPDAIATGRIQTQRVSSLLSRGTGNPDRQRLGCKRADLDVNVLA